MTAASTKLPESYQKLATLDFRDDKRNVYTSYVMRLAALIVFMPMFAFVAAAVRPGWEFNPGDFWNLNVPGASGIGVFALLAGAIIGILYVHELLHALVFRIAGAQDTQIGFRGVMIFAACRGWYFTRPWMIINAVVPFFAVSIIGTVGMALVPSDALAWVFIPILVNASASGGDFMTLSWLLLAPRGILVGDDGDVLTAYLEPGE